ncbi:MAG: hypothetical protein EPN46_02315 [Candidimonas sp.]|nr:MAG: hypothetical protein EPN77_06905 [Candidimonas sp.]TAM19517.1 MAG: hypothetical protein EPN62_18210 [Candidimonas sp.]TAM80167.1 MAG: hypothetical protein EPN46_02315 [Candidimonas sp.]
MKAGIFLISLLAMAAAWYWIGHDDNRSQPISQQLKSAFKCVAIGIAVYFSLLFVVLIYLMTTAH